MLIPCARSWGDFICPQGWLLKRFHLSFSTVLTCRSSSFCTKEPVQKPLTTWNYINRRHFFNTKLTLCYESWCWFSEGLKAVFLPIPLICPHVLHPVKKWNPGSAAVFDVPRRTYEELISKTSYIHCYMLLICSSGHSKKSPFSTQNWLQMENVDTIWNLEQQISKNSILLL